MNSIEEYLRICRDEKRLGPKTLKLYERELVTLSQLGTVEAIRSHLAKLAPATVVRKLVIWRSFAKRIQSDLLPFLTAVDRPPLKQREPSFLTGGEVEKIRSQIRDLEVTDRMFFELGLSMGLRSAEILSLRASDFEEDWIVITRKGNVKQRLPVSDEVKSLAGSFQSFKRTHCYYWKLVKKVAQKSGIKKTISPHSLRHTFATLKANEGHSLAALQRFLGHSKLSTTERYLHVTPEYLRTIVRGK